MAKASLTLPTGTVVQIEGTTEEVQTLLRLFGTEGHNLAGGKAKGEPQRRPRKRRSPAKQAPAKAEESGPSLSEIVNLTKTCDEAEDIERQILDRASDEIKPRYRKLVAELLQLSGVRK
jgi:hypothetical protein